MQAPAIPLNEKERLNALYSYNIFDLLEEQEYQGIVELAANICETPISIISLLDKDKEWYKVKFGIENTYINRRNSFCAHVINASSKQFVVEDATKEERFADNPLVTGASPIIFYAGIPLVTKDGFGLGTLCVIDQKPRQLTTNQLRLLNVLAQQVMRLFEDRKAVKTLQLKEAISQKTIIDLHDYTAMVAHDLKTPLRDIELMTEVLRKTHQADFEETSMEYLDNIHQASVKSMQFINNLLKYSKSVHTINEEKVLVEIEQMLHSVCNNLNLPDDISVEIPENLPTMYHSKAALQHIFENLIQNGIEHRDKANFLIQIGYEKGKNHHVFTITDNGPTIPKEHQEAIFELSNKGRYDEDRHPRGIGLAIANKLIGLLGGKIKVNSDEIEGTTFTVKIPNEVTSGE